MKKRVYDYLQQHPHADINKISAELHENALDVLNTVNSLITDGYVKMNTPVNVDLYNYNSCYYSTTGKGFIEK